MEPMGLTPPPSNAPETAEENEFPDKPGLWFWVSPAWTPGGTKLIAKLIQVKEIDGKLWANMGDCRSDGALYELAELHPRGWFNVDPSRAHAAEREKDKEQIAILQSQVENADANLEQVRLNVEHKHRARIAELERKLADAERQRDDIEKALRSKLNDARIALNGDSILAKLAVRLIDDTLSKLGGRP